MRYKSEETMEQILKAVERLYLTDRCSPSIGKLSMETGRAKSTIHSYLREMNRRGMLFYDGKRIETAVTRKANSEIVYAPLLGSIACGEPEFEEENYEAYFALPAALFGRGSFFLLRARGQSMIEAGIYPGDLVVVKQQHTANNGDIVVALVNNETTLKRFYIDTVRNCVRLHPENRRMKDIYVHDCRIQGVAHHVIKSLR